VARRIGDVAVIIPDASPVLTLARIERVDLLGSFSVPVRIVDQVHYEITKPDMTSSIQYDFMIAIRYRDDMGIDITMSISFYGDICTKPNGPLPAMP
jgi:hypothetical protein